MWGGQVSVVLQFVTKSQPFQNPYDRKTPEMRRTIVGREHLRMKKNYDPLAGGKMLRDIKSPWLKRILKKVKDKE